VTVQPRLRITWAGAGLLALLDSLGVAVLAGVVELQSARIELGAERGHRLAGLAQLDVDELPPGPGPATAPSAAIDVAAVGWATVDLDRAAANFGDRLGGQEGSSFIRAPADRLLGASVRRSAGRRPDLLLLQPDTEGRLAGALARYGEGPVALYLRVPNLDRIANGPTTRQGAGPLGPARLVLDGPPAGPFVLLVAGPPPRDDGPAPSNDDRVPSEP